MDFGMAVAAGIIPKAQKAQKDLINLAGGRNVFKSEGWWNTQIDKQIKSGYREKETGTEYMTKSGKYVLGKKTVTTPNVLYDFSGPQTVYTPPKDALITGYNQSSIQYGYIKTPIYKTRQVDVYAGREDFTEGELSDITKSAKRGAEAIKRTAAESKASKRRLSRATGGLIGKAIQPGQAPATGLPALGAGGLGITESILGGGIKL